MAAKTRRKPRMGRPPKAGAKRYSIRITDAVANYYRKLGDGNLTLGIERAASNQSEALSAIPQCTGENKRGACPMRDKCDRWQGPVSPLKRTYGLIFAPFTLELHDQEPHTMWQAECGEFVERVEDPTGDV